LGRDKNAWRLVVWSEKVEALAARNSGEIPDGRKKFNILILFRDPFFYDGRDWFVKRRSEEVTGDWSGGEQRLGEHLNDAIFRDVSDHPSHLGGKDLKFSGRVKLCL
jgi:hypothetical protein